MKKEGEVEDEGRLTVAGGQRQHYTYYYAFIPDFV